MKLSQRLANLALHRPLVAATATGLYRLTRPRFTSGVVGVIFNDRDEILFVKHVYHPETPWGLPGGWQDARENPVETLRRELDEELGLKVDILYPLMIERRKNRRHLDIAYLCHAKNNVQDLCVELTDYRWCTPDSRPSIHPYQERVVELALAPRDEKERNQ
ncbi:MAG: NUDIX hydrolase [Anaerolineae bacterium]|nr:NUDIX hydrolase [Anaerolineae bacterium]